MVKRQKFNTKKKRNGKGFKENDTGARKIDVSMNLLKMGIINKI